MNSKFNFDAFILSYNNNNNKIIIMIIIMIMIEISEVF